MLQSVALLAEWNQAEVSVFSWHFNLVAHLNQRFLLQSVGYHILDADDLHVPLLGKLQQLGHTCHRAVFVHNLHQCSSGIESSHTAQIDGGFGMSASTQHTVILCVEWVYVSWTSECLRLCCWIGQSLDGFSAIVGTNTCGASLQFVDRYGEWGAEYRCVVLNLMWQVKLLASLDGDRCTKHSTGILQHEVYFLCCNLLGSYYQVAFVLAVFIVNYNHELAFFEVLDGFFYAIQLHLFHIITPY